MKKEKKYTPNIIEVQSEEAERNKRKSPALLFIKSELRAINKKIDFILRELDRL